MTDALPTWARNLVLVLVVATALSHVQTHAQATIAEALSPSAPTSTRAKTPDAPVAEPAEAWVLPKEVHAWARFSIGSWREIEVTTETFDEHGAVFGRSVTTQKEVLKAVADDSYVIDVQATVDVAGKRIAGPWSTRVLRLATDRSGAIFSTSQEHDETVALTPGMVDCRVIEVQYSDETRNLCDRILFSRRVFPHVLRRDTYEKLERTPIQALPQDSISIIARAVPLEWEGRILKCATQRTVRRREKGESQSLAVLSPEVPGGEVRAQSTDFDSSGRRVRWSVQKLLAYGTTRTTPTGPETTVTRYRAPGDQN